MRFPRRNFLHLAAGAAVLPAVCRGARAEAYPSRPITMVVPFPPGGPNDVIGRIMAEAMRTSLGQDINIDNVAGSAGSIGTGRLAAAAGDGYTIGMGYWGTHVANGALYSLAYDVVNDFEPISLLVQSPLLVAAKKTVPANDLTELLGWLKANPNKVSAAVPGSGSHIMSVFFQKETGTQFRLVPYRGAGPAIEDLVQGRIDMALLDAGPPLAKVRDGAIKAYAVTAMNRLAVAPDIPTANEAGLPGFYATVWFGLWAPKNTSKPIIARLNSAAVAALESDSK